MVLGFRFVTKRVSRAHWCFSYSWAVLIQHQGLFCSSACPSHKWARGVAEAGRGHRQDIWLQLTKGTPLTLCCCASNTWAQRRISSTSTLTGRGVPLLPREVCSHLKWNIFLGEKKKNICCRKSGQSSPVWDLKALVSHSHLARISQPFEGS